MFSNVLKWAFKYGEKEAHLLLDNDTSLEMVKQIAYDMIAHCSKVEEQQKVMKAAEEAKKATESTKADEVKPPDVVD